MTVGELKNLLKAEMLTDGGAERKVKCGFACDVLSVAMAKGHKDMAWITVQANMNALAVAVMRSAACLVFPDGMRPEESVIQKAQGEGVALLSAKGNAFELAGRMYAAGLRGDEMHE